MIYAPSLASCSMWHNVVPQLDCSATGCLTLSGDVPHMVSFHLSVEFRKGLAWFYHFLPLTNRVFLIHEDARQPVPHFMDACTSGCRALMGLETYHSQFLNHIPQQGISICHLEVLNATVAIKSWAPKYANRLVHLFSDNTTAVSIFQAGRGRDPFLQACTC